MLELGPVNEDNLYDYSIISDNVGAFLFVLARNVTVFYEKYNADVSATLVTLGFTGLKTPIPTYQGSDCVYEADLSNDDHTVPADTNSSSDESGFWSKSSSKVILASCIAAGVAVAAFAIYWFKFRNTLGKDEPLLKY